jgi:hypothetical protein
MKFLLISLMILVTGVLSAQTAGTHGRVVVTRDHHDLQYEDGTPFFWLGDTGWELFHRLDRDEIARYLDNRSRKGFTVIQAVILAEFDGLRKPNRYGEVPFSGLDPDKPNEKYFELVDWTLKEAEKKGLIIGLLPTWGDKVTQLWGEGPVIFNERNAFDYGLFLGKRYAQQKNLIWILGGDRPAVKDSLDWRPVWRAMAKGIREGTGQKALISYHTWGGANSTSQYLQQEDWLDINMMQSGHGGGHDVPVWEWITRDRALLPTKPTLDAEPNYEDHPVNPWPKWDPANGYFRDHDVRKQTYRSVFAGACGVTYGHHAVWQFWSPREEKINYADRYWTEAIDRPGAFQVGYLRDLVLSRPSLGRVPDDSIIAAGQGEKGAHMTAFHGADGSYAMVYLPMGTEITVNTSHVTGKNIHAWWFNPRSKASISPGYYPKAPSLRFTPPQTGGENDWVLVLDDASKNYSAPGKKQ